VSTYLELVAPSKMMAEFWILSLRTALQANDGVQDMQIIQRHNAFKFPERRISKLVTTSSSTVSPSTSGPKKMKERQASRPPALDLTKLHRVSLPSAIMDSSFSHRHQSVLSDSAPPIRRDSILTTSTLSASRSASGRKARSMYLRPQRSLTATSSSESTGSTLVDETPLDNLPRRVASLLSQSSVTPSPTSSEPGYDTLLAKLTEKSQECDKLNHRLSRLALGAQKAVICEDSGVQTSDESPTGTEVANAQADNQVGTSQEESDFKRKLEFFERFAKSEASPASMTSNGADSAVYMSSPFDGSSIIDDYM
jgi:hypothetical protein